MNKSFHILLNFCVSFCLAQNLVPNGDFEIYSSCPSGISQITNSTGWVNGATNSTPDYFNSCATYSTGVSIPSNGFAYQATNSGSGYSGIYTFNESFPDDAREYIEIQLSDTLVAGKKYLASIHVSLSNYAKYSISSIGMYFTPNFVTSPIAFMYVANPQVKSTIQLNDTLNWMLVQDTVTAVGNELYLTIGNFSYASSSDTVDVSNGAPSYNSSYYYIDDVSVIDVATIGIKEAHAEKSSINIYPNPATTTVTISIETNSKVLLTDIFGKTVHAINIQPGTNNMNVSELENGMYFLYIEDQEGKAISARKIFVQR